MLYLFGTVLKGFYVKHININTQNSQNAHFIFGLVDQLHKTNKIHDKVQPCDFQITLWIFKLKDFDNTV